ncbi:hypothetical protein SAMN06272735_3814 [Streptomyces sp. TLI_55]|uniref:hypothetical protein n=1 Tax=Streptomyces sp. TLI_55 TaxID=1938861 RepID=UPI000BD30CD6|nr:hypothetical protein [Streptomyces sp. TLI_55]SNX62063.1 hypothetical protein SAMN06272735_3814 [Streptomyces sp. TLI_55]
MSSAGNPGDGGPGAGQPPDDRAHRRAARATIWQGVVVGIATIVAAVLAAYFSGVFNGGSDQKPTSSVSSAPLPPGDTGDSPTPKRPVDDRTSETPDDEITSEEPDGALTADERALAERVGGDLSGCRSADPGDYASVAVNCESAQGPATDPIVLSFADADQMRNWMTEETSDFTVSETGSCENHGNYAGLWNLYGTDAGTVACHWGDGVYRIAWSFEDQLIGVVAESPDADSLVTWWKSAPVDP